MAIKLAKSEKNVFDKITGRFGVNSTFDNLMRLAVQGMAREVEIIRPNAEHVVKGQTVEGKPDWVSQADQNAQAYCIRKVHGRYVGKNKDELVPEGFYQLELIVEEGNKEYPGELNLAGSGYQRIALSIDGVCGSRENEQERPNVFCNTALAVKHDDGTITVEGVWAINANTKEMFWSKPGTLRIHRQYGEKYTFINDIQRSTLREKRLCAREERHVYSPMAQRLFVGKGNQRCFRGKDILKGSIMVNTFDVLQNNTSGLLLTPHSWDSETDKLRVDSEGNIVKRPIKPYDAWPAEGLLVKAGFIFFDILEEGFKASSAILSFKEEAVSHERLAIHKDNLDEFIEWAQRTDTKLINIEKFTG